MRYHPKREADRISLSLFWPSGRWMHFWRRWGDRVNQHSPLSSGVKLALCGEGRGWLLLCVKSQGWNKNPGSYF